MWEQQPRVSLPHKSRTNEGLPPAWLKWLHLSQTVYHEGHKGTCCQRINLKLYLYAANNITICQKSVNQSQQYKQFQFDHDIIVVIQRPRAEMLQTYACVPGGAHVPAISCNIHTWGRYLCAANGGVVALE